MQSIYLSISEVAERYGVNRSTIWRWIKSNANSRKVIPLSPGCSRWRLSDLESWEATRKEAG